MADIARAAGNEAVLELLSTAAATAEAAEATAAAAAAAVVAAAAVAGGGAGGGGGAPRRLWVATLDPASRSTYYYEFGVDNAEVVWFLPEGGVLVDGDTGEPVR